MNQGAGRRVLMKKTACKKSHATVPLNVMDTLLIFPIGRSYLSTYVKYFYNFFTMLYWKASHLKDCLASIEADKLSLDRPWLRHPAQTI